MSTRDATVPTWMESQPPSSASIIVKTETGEKPKFVPKIPVKKENTAEKPSVASTEKKFTTKSEGEKAKNKNRDKLDNRGNNNRNVPGSGFKPHSSGRGAGGRGQWVMPTGTAFFTGNSATVPVAAPSNGGTAISRPDVTQRIMRPNEAAILAQSFPVKTEDVKYGLTGASSDNSLASYYAAKRASEDSDSDDVCDEEQGGPTDRHGVEIWPPTQYDALAPLSLPLGPKTANMRVMLAAEPILADPHDAAALEKEESSSLFLIQMPSDLKFDTILESRRTEESAGTMSKIGGMNTVKDGKLGKLQLLKSGKVRLVTNSGHSYEVSSGLAASFSQYLACIRVEEVTEGGIGGTDSTAATASSSSGANTHTKNSAQGRKKGVDTSSSSSKTNSSEPVLDPRRTGSMHFMGNITKKLVITPNYEIGTKKNKVGGGASGTKQSTSAVVKTSEAEVISDMAYE